MFLFQVEWDPEVSPRSMRRAFITAVSTKPEGYPLLKKERAILLGALSSNTTFHSLTNSEETIKKMATKTSSQIFDKQNMQNLVALLTLNDQETEITKTTSEVNLCVSNLQNDLGNPSKKRKRNIQTQK